MTNHYIDMKNAGCFLVFSNPAENHPSCMQYVNEARFGANKAPMLVVEPRRTRMGSMLQTGEERVNGKDVFCRIRPGTDIAFINGILKRHFANVDASGDTSATTSLDTEVGSYMRRLGPASGGWFNDKASMPTNWPYWTDSLFRTNEGYGSVPAGKPTDYLRYGRDVNASTGLRVDNGNPSAEFAVDPNKTSGWLAVPANALWANNNLCPVIANDLNASASGGTMTVYETYKARVAGYSSAEVANICGCDAATFEQVADTYLNNSWDYNHPKSHVNDDTTNVVAAANATDLASAQTLANEIKTDYNLHRTQAGVHVADDTTNDVTSLNATDLASLQTLVNEIKADLNAHRTEAGVHTIDDITSSVSSVDATNLNTAIVLVNELKADYNSHRAIHNATGYRAGTILYAMGTTQHTHGSANVKSYANLQIMTGNIGKHGGGVNALRGIGNVQGSTDMNLLYHILMAYVATPPADTVSSAAAAGASSYKTKKSNFFAESTNPDYRCKVKAGDVCGYAKLLANTRGVTSITGPVAGEYTVNLDGNLGAALAKGDKVFMEYESWLLAKSFGGRSVWPSYKWSPASGLQNPGYGHFSWGGGLPWGHQGTWAVVRTFCSRGDGDNTGGFYPAANIGGEHAITEVLYDDYMAKGAGMDHRTMVNQTSPSMPGHDPDLPDQEGWVVWGMNPRVTVANALNVGDALKNLTWLVGVDMFINETYDAPRKSGGITYFLPAASPMETTGTTSNSGRWIQWRYQAVEPLGGSRTDLEILFKLARALHVKCDGVGPGDINCGYTGVPNNGVVAYNNIWKAQYADMMTITGFGEGEKLGTGNGTTGPYNFTVADGNCIANTVKIGWTSGGAAQSDTDNGGGGWTASGGTVNYGTGAISITLATPADFGTSITVDYASTSSYTFDNGSGGNLADPATAWSNDDYRASLEGPDNGILGGSPAPLGYAGYAERVAIQTNTSAWDQYGNPGTNWLHGSSRQGGGKYGAFHCPRQNHRGLLDNPKTTHGDNSMFNRTQARSNVDGPTNKGVYGGFSWVWLRNRRCFYNKGGFCPDDVGDIFVTPNEVGTTFVKVPGHSNSPPVIPYSGCWRGRRAMKDIPINTGDQTWDRLGFTPVHWEPHETQRADLVTTYAQIGKKSVEPYADDVTDRTNYPLILTTFRHTEHFQGGPMTRNVPWLTELVPQAVIEINPVDAAARGILDGDAVEVKSMRTGGNFIGKWKAVVSSGPSATQKTAPGVVAVPWHWGYAGLATGPTANEICIDALDGNTNMPETKACLCEIQKTTWS